MEQGTKSLEARRRAPKPKKPCEDGRTKECHWLQSMSMKHRLLARKRTGAWSLACPQSGWRHKPGEPLKLWKIKVDGKEVLGIEKQPAEEYLLFICRMIKQRGKKNYYIYNTDTNNTVETMLRPMALGNNVCRWCQRISRRAKGWISTVKIDNHELNGLIFQGWLFENCWSMSWSEKATWCIISTKLRGKMLQLWSEKRQ